MGQVEAGLQLRWHLFVLDVTAVRFCSGLNVLLQQSQRCACDDGFEPVHPPPDMNIIYYSELIPVCVLCSCPSASLVLAPVLPALHHGG